MNKEIIKFLKKKQISNWKIIFFIIAIIIIQLSKILIK